LRPRDLSRDLRGSSCDIPANSGLGSGVCSDSVASVRGQVSFCKDSIRYRACLPAHQPPWDGWNATAKDRLLSDLFKSMVEARLAREMNNSPDEYVERKLLSNPDCVMALRNLLCWYNFPKCDDRNRSLPLCQTVCENYYRACKFESSSVDGMYDQCRASVVKTNGLFGTGNPGPDHVLAQDTATCESTAEESNRILREAEETRPWIFQPGGITLLATSAAVLLLFAYVLLVPFGLRAYIAWAFARCMHGPLQIWRSLPVLKGNSILCGFVLVFIVLFGVGVYRRLDLGLGYKHPELEGGTAAEVAFKPPESAYRIETVWEMEPLRRRQLIGSCTCTGAAVGLRPSRWIWIRAALLLPLTRTARLFS